MRCEKCGKKLGKNETFCSVCGFFNEPDDDLDDSDNWETVSSDNEVKAIDDILEEKVTYGSGKDEDAKEDESFTKENSKEEVIETDEENLENYIDNEDLVDIIDEEEIKKKEKKEKKHQKKEKISAEEKEFYYEDEDILESYIGEDYKIIKKSPFNIFAFLLSWIYLLYRKLYLTGMFGLFLTGVVIICFRSKIVIGIYAFLSMLLWGLFFNKYYIFIARKRIKYLKDHADDTDRFRIMHVSAEKGGVRSIPALIIYAAFLIFILILLLNIRISKAGNRKFWSDNSENRASCLDLIKKSNNHLKEQEGYGEIEEATCKVAVGDRKEYSIYLKTNSEIYLYYQTEEGQLLYKNTTADLDLYQEKISNNTITDAERQELVEKQNLKYIYTSIYNKSIEEDKLIKNKKNTSQKTNYFFGKEEITR